MPFRKPVSPVLDRKNPLTKGLVLCLPFSEKGRLAKDLAKNKLTATFTVAPTFIKGAGGAGLRFNGSSTYLDLGSNTVISKRTHQTILAVARPNATTGAHVFISEHEAAGVVFLAFFEDNKIKYSRNRGGSWADVLGNMTLGTAKTRAFIYTLHPTNGVKLYVDGILDKTDATVVLPNDQTITDVEIGRYNNGGGGAWQNADTFMLCCWDRVLTPSEVADISADPYQIFVRPKMSLGKAPAAAVASTSRRILFRPAWAS